MTPTKLLIGQILMVLAIIVASIWTATQWAAAALAYQPELGAPWITAFGHPVYYPWSIFLWWFSFDAYAPDIFDEAGAIAAAGGFMGCGAAIAGSLWRARQSNNLTTYGSARWADHKDIRAAELFDQRGVALDRIGKPRSSWQAVSIPRWRRSAPASLPNMPRPTLSRRWPRNGSSNASGTASRK